MTKQNWQKIYSAGQQLNRYPYDFVVSNFFHLAGQFDHQPLKVLDLGCGGGNHAIFCAENGAQVTAVDYSTAALAAVEQRAEQQGLSHLIDTEQVDFDHFELTSASGFDFVIDRLSVTQAPRKNALQVYERVYELLNDGGYLLSNLLSLGHSHKDFGRYCPDNDVWLDFTGGIFEDLLTASFYSEAEVRSLVDKYHLVNLTCETNRTITQPYGCMELWKIIAQK